MKQNDTLQKWMHQELGIYCKWVSTDTVRVLHRNGCGTLLLRSDSGNYVLHSYSYETCDTLGSGESISNLGGSIAFVLEALVVHKCNSFLALFSIQPAGSTLFNVDYNQLYTTAVSKQRTGIHQLSEYLLIVFDLWILVRCVVAMMGGPEDNNTSQML